MLLLYDSIGPNPRVVRMFAAERGVALARRTVDLRGGENRREPYLRINPAGQLPALALPDGTVITEITAICEFLDEVASGGPSLIGQDPAERAQTRMWTRRIDLNIVEPMSQGYRYSNGLKLFQDRVRCIPQAADDLKRITQDRLAWLDRLIAGRPFVCGPQLTLADLLLFAFVDFGIVVGQPPAPSLAAIHAHYKRIRARPSASA